MNEFSNKKKYILFGAGDIGRKALRFWGGENVAFFCDNNKIGEHVEEKEIISVHQLKKIYQDYSVVITIVKAQFVIEIVMQLYRLEIPFSLLEEELGAFVEQDLQKLCISDRFGSNGKCRRFGVVLLARFVGSTAYL